MLAFDIDVFHLENTFFVPNAEEQVVYFATFDFHFYLWIWTKCRLKIHWNNELSFARQRTLVNGLRAVITERLMLAVWDANIVELPEREKRRGARRREERKQRTYLPICFFYTGQLSRRDLPNRNFSKDWLFTILYIITLKCWNDRYTML